MYVFENDIKFNAGPYKMFDEITKPNKIERHKKVKNRLGDRKKNKKVPEYMAPRGFKYGYLKGK